MRAHHFVADGCLEDGDPRLRCSRCGMLSHWAGARDACPWLDAASVARLAAMDADVRVLVSSDGASTHWEGPYRRHKWLTCARCSARFRHPKRFRVISFCGPMCVRENDMARNRDHAAAYRERTSDRPQGES